MGDFFFNIESTKWDLSAFFFTKLGEKKPGDKVNDRHQSEPTRTTHVHNYSVTFEIPIQVTLHGDECSMYQ